MEAQPSIRAIVRGKLGPSCSDSDDICSEVVVDLMVRLRESKLAGSGAIDDFNGYVAAAAYNACSNYLRRKNPLRWRLQNRLRYVLNHDPQFALWEGAGRRRLCGLAEWRGRKSVEPLPSIGGPGETGRNLAPHDLLLRIFRLHGGPLEMQSLVDLAASFSGAPLGLVEESAPVETFPDRRPGADIEIEQRSYAQRLWTEIRDLPPRQRQALLLNLPDDGVSLFLLTGVAPFRRIAETLEMSADEFAALFNDLPLDDNAIAARLGVTRQQVINLRMSARKRLSNRFGRES